MQSGGQKMSKKDFGCADIILAYLNEKNRPYSVQDVFGNLQKEHGLGKTAVMKAMEHLAQEGKIKEKVYGKQKIYFADQSQFPDAGESELRALDSRVAELAAQVQSVSQSCRQMDAELKELKELTSSLTTAEMISQIQELKAECEGYQERLLKIKSASNHITPEEREKVFKQRSLHVKEWKKRKRLATDMVDAILEGYPKSKKQFLEEVGVETDEDHKVTIPNI